MKMQCTVRKGEMEYTFLFFLHSTLDGKKLMLDAEEFYAKYGKPITKGWHHEFEILEPGEEFFEQHKLHVHRSTQNGKLFICYPFQVPYLSPDAQVVVRAWCAGSVSTITDNFDLNHALNECKNDLTWVPKLLQERFNIQTSDPVPLE